MARLIKRVIPLLILGIVSINLCEHFLVSDLCSLVKPGDPFPEMKIDLTAFKEAKGYLGIKKEGEIEISEITVDLLVIEVLSVYCVSCMTQTSYDRELFRMIRTDKKTVDRVKMIGLAAGNNFREVSRFVRKFAVPYPVFPDPGFQQYDKIGTVRTPFTLFLLKKPDKRYHIVATKMGIREDVQGTFNMILSILGGTYSPEKEKEVAAAKVTPIPPELIDRLLKDWLRERGEALNINELFEESGATVYKIGSHGPNFAMVINVPSACDICKEVKFVYIIDRNGNVLDILPIQLSKLNNETFHLEDIAKIKRHLVSRNIKEGVSFNPDVDAVTSATITSGLIYSSINKGIVIYNILMEKGYIQ